MTGRHVLQGHCLRSHHCLECLHFLYNRHCRVGKGRIPLPKRMNFRKSSKRPLTPPPAHFRKVMLQIFSEIHDQSIVYNGKNLQHKFLD